MAHPAISDDGTLDTTKLWEPTARNKIIRRSTACNRLRVGGTGSSKSSDAMMEIVTEYLLRFPGCFALIMRTTMPELERTNIPNFKAYVPKECYSWNDQKHIATFGNGSKLFFSHLQYFRWVDLEAYQSASFPVIFFDECGGFPLQVWQFFQARNRVNPECTQDSKGNWPVPCILGATNPIGAYWAEYNDYFVRKQPDGLPEGSRKDRHGRIWSPLNGPDADPKRAEDWRLEYDPFEWDFIHSTIFDNPHLLAKDPGIVERLNRMPRELRQKLLDGLLDSTVGQYFDCFDPAYDVINLREDPDAIIWQHWQPRWLGWDWGRAHWNAVVWLTKAMVRRGSGEYRLKTVCYREYVDRGRDYTDMADIVAKMTRMGLPGATDQDRAERKGCDYRAAYFSHEKFAKQMEGESPAAKLTKYLMDRGMTGVTRGTTDRVGRATLLYHVLKIRDFVILDSCPEIIRAIPQCTRDEGNLEDVLKVDTKADDCFVGGTMVATERGEMPIETLIIGDKVLTRAGLKSVIRTHSIERECVLVSGTVNLCGTPDHRIWTPSGWRPLAKLAGASVLRRSSATASGGADTQTQPNWSTAATSLGQQPGSKDASAACIGKYGATFSGRLQQAITSTIKTKISAIITLAIWSRYSIQIILAIMYLRVRLIPPVLRLCSGSLRESVRSPKTGTLPLLAGNGILAIARNPGPSANILRECVSIARTVSTLSIPGNGAAKVANKHTDALRVRTIFKRLAIDSARLLFPANTTRCAIVRADVRVKPIGKQRVYDLTVADVHEFFANGVLVSNCYDGLTLGLFGELGSRPKPQEDKDREKLDAAKDPMQRFMTQFRVTKEREKRQAAIEDRSSVCE